MRSKKNNKKKIFIALIIGIVLTFMIFNILNAQNQKLLDQEALLAKIQKEKNKPQVVVKKTKKVTRKAVVTKFNMKKNSKIDPKSVKIKEIESKNLPPGYINDVLSILNKRVVKDIKSGEILKYSDLSSEDPSGFDIELGKRAITIPKEFIQGIASHIKVGSKVDILSTSKSKGKRPELVLQNVEIISLETMLGSGDNEMPATKASAITFEIPAKKSPNLVNAMVNGKLQIIVRGHSDEKIISTNPFNFTMKKSKKLPPPPDESKLLQNTKRSDLPKPQKPVSKTKTHKLEFIEANVKTEHTFTESIH